MKNTGITRKLDELGRITIPKEIRKQLEIVKNKSRVEIFIDGDSIVLKKYHKGCIFCDSTKKLTQYKNKHICYDCKDKILRRFMI